MPDTSYWQDLLQRSGIPGMGGTASFAPPGLGPSTQEAAGVPAVPPQAQQMAMAGQGQQQTPVTAGPIGNPQRQQDEQTLQQDQSRGSGVDSFAQRHHILGGLVKGLDIAGSVAVPGLMDRLPGTTLNHEQTLSSDREAVRGDIANEQKQAQTRSANAEATKAERPPVVTPKYQPVQTAQGIGAFNDATGGVTPVTMNGQPAQPVEKSPKPDIHAMYADAVADALHRGVEPKEDPKVKQLASAITGLEKATTVKEPGHDDKAIEIYSKQPGARTPEEQSYLKGYEQYVNKTKVQPGVARMEVMMNGRPVTTVDPNNPENLIYQSAGNAIKTGAEAPGSIGYQVSKGVEQDFTHGKDATILNNINTAHEHVKQWQRVSEALANGNTKVFNQLSQAWAARTGKPAPTNFQMVKTALVGEIAKTFSGGVATVEETKQIGEAINAANSPKQLAGVAAQAAQLMESKRAQLRQQYTEGKQGKPNFGESTGGNLQTIKTQAQFDALPSGAEYLNNGKPHRKP